MREYFVLIQTRTSTRTNPDTGKSSALNFAAHFHLGCQRRAPLLSRGTYVLTSLEGTTYLRVSPRALPSLSANCTRAGQTRWLLAPTQAACSPTRLTVGLYSGLESCSWFPPVQIRGHWAPPPDRTLISTIFDESALKSNIFKMCTAKKASADSEIRVLINVQSCKATLPHVLLLPPAPGLAAGCVHFPKELRLILPPALAPSRITSPVPLQQQASSAPLHWVCSWSSQC